MRARNLAYKCAKRSRKQNHWQMYRMKRNEVANKMKRAKRNYFNTLNSADQKAFWKATKFVKKETRIPFLRNCNRDIISDDEEKAAILNNFFSQCFNTSIPVLSDDDMSTFVDMTLMNMLNCCVQRKKFLICCEILIHLKQQGQMGYQQLC